MTIRPDINSCSTVLQVVYSNLAGVQMYLDHGSEYSMLRAGALLQHIVNELDALRSALLEGSNSEEPITLEAKQEPQQGFILFPNEDPIPFKVEAAEPCKEIVEEAPEEQPEEQPEEHPAALAAITDRGKKISMPVNMDAYHLLQFMLQNPRGRKYVISDFVDVLSCSMGDNRLNDAVQYLLDTRSLVRKGNDKYIFVYSKAVENLCNKLVEVRMWLKGNYAPGLTASGLHVQFPRCNKIAPRDWFMWLKAVLVSEAEKHGEEVNPEADRFLPRQAFVAGTSIPAMVAEALTLKLMDSGEYHAVTHKVLCQMLGMDIVTARAVTTAFRKAGLIVKDGKTYIRTPGGSNEDSYAWKVLAHDFIKSHVGPLGIEEVLREIPYPNEGSYRSKVAYNIAQTIRYYGKV